MDIKCYFKCNKGNGSSTSSSLIYSHDINKTYKTYQIAVNKKKKIDKIII